MRLADLQMKDIISTINGRKVGRIIDAEIDNNGQIKYLIVEPKKMLKNFFSNSKEAMIAFNQINKIGEDVILVDIP